MDFCLGTVVFILLGYGLLVGPHVAGGFIGIPTLAMFGEGLPALTGAVSSSSWSFALLVPPSSPGPWRSGPRFSAYCLYSTIISLVIYPIEAGWVWGEGGWLGELGFIDFAGSCVIHMAGGITALLGPSSWVPASASIR